MHVLALLLYLRFAVPRKKIILLFFQYCLLLILVQSVLKAFVFCGVL